jgi:hypothetical protein
MSSPKNRLSKPSACTVTSIRSRSAWMTGKVPPPASSFAVKNQRSTPDAGAVGCIWSWLSTYPSATIVRSADWVFVGMRLYSSMIFTGRVSQSRQAIVMSASRAAFTRSRGSGMPTRSEIVSCGWPCWTPRRTSGADDPASTPMSTAIVVLPRPGPPTSRQRPPTAKVSSGSRTFDAKDGSRGSVIDASASPRGYVTPGSRLNSTS